jgi:serine/threonine protein phosphatase PrpC
MSSGTEMQDAHAIFETGAATHVGKVRQRNEDSYLARPEIGIWAVADGMGGHDYGDIASQTLIEALGSIERPTSAADLLSRCESQVAVANCRLKAIGRERGGATIGTTVAVLLAYDSHYACVWSGDSRIYVVRAGQLTQLSRDHTEVQELLSGGVITPAEAKTWSGSNVITRAIGVFDEPELEMTSGPLQPGDSFVICSDGLTHHVQDQEILSCVHANFSQQACDRLLELTLERGATDNVTIIVVRYQPESASLTHADAELPDLSELRG